MAAELSAGVRWVWFSTKIKILFYSTFTGYADELSKVLKSAKNDHKESMDRTMPLVFAGSNVRPAPDAAILARIIGKCRKYARIYHKMKSEATQKQLEELRLFNEIKKDEEKIREYALRKKSMHKPEPEQLEHAAASVPAVAPTSAENTAAYTITTSGNSENVIHNTISSTETAVYEVSANSQQQQQQIQQIQQVQNLPSTNEGVYLLQQQMKLKDVEPTAVLVTPPPPRKVEPMNVPTSEEIEGKISLPTREARNPCSLFKILGVDTSAAARLDGLEDLNDVKSAVKVVKKDKGSHAIFFIYSTKDGSMTLARISSFMSRFGELASIVLSNETTNKGFGMGIIQYSLFTSAMRALNYLNKVQGGDNTEETVELVPSNILIAQWARFGNKYFTEGDIAKEKAPVWYNTELANDDKVPSKSAGQKPAVPKNSKGLSSSSASAPKTGGLTESETIDLTKVYITDQAVRETIEKIVDKLHKADEIISKIQEPENAEDKEKLNHLIESRGKLDQALKIIISNNQDKIVPLQNENGAEYATRDEAYKAQQALLGKLKKQQEGIHYDEEQWMKIRRQLVITLLPTQITESNEAVDVLDTEAEEFVLHKAKELGVLLDGIGRVSMSDYKSYEDRLEASRRRGRGGARSGPSWRGSGRAGANMDDSGETLNDIFGEGTISQDREEIDIDDTYNDQQRDRIVIRIADTIPTDLPDGTYIDDTFARSQNKTKTGLELLVNNGIIVRYFNFALDIRDIE